MAVLTPISRPLESRSGPPELPGLIAASVWITSRMMRPAGERNSRPSALITPTVSVWSSPNGLPTASTRRPTSRSAERPSASGTMRATGARIFSTARSFSGAAPTSRASQSDLSARVTENRLASSMTWKLVTTCPSRSQKKPAPEPFGIWNSSRKKSRYSTTVVM